MGRVIPVVAIVAVLAVCGGFLVFGGFTRANAETFHVNYDKGRDEADGLSPGAAWKHAPGDPKAQGAPARAKLRAGDTVLFAAGVRYRGSILVSASGTANAPIVFAGEGPGAIIDGSEPARAEPCASAADCGGVADWRRMTRITVNPSGKPIGAVFTSTGPLRPAQGPDPKNDFYRDEIDDMAEVDGVAMSRGEVRLPHATAVGLATGGGTLLLWVRPNLVVERPILSIAGDVARFDPAGLQFYTDRPARAAVANHPSLIDRPGEYIVLPGPPAVMALLAPGTTGLTVGAGRGGFHLRIASHIVIRNLGFENMDDAGGELPPAGVAIFADRGEGLTVEKNRFANFVMPRGQGPIITRRVSNIRIAGNRIETVTLGSGMRLSGPASGVLVEDNDIRRIGRTGIMLMEIDHGVVQRNRITDISGVHGNGLSAYLGNHDVSFLANTVVDAKLPATFHGVTANSTHDNDLVFANNLFVAQPDALGALLSWGHTRGVTIRNNVLLGGRAGLMLNENDQGVVITDNVASGLLYGRNRPTAWTIVGNEWTALTYLQKRESPAPPVSQRWKTATADLAQGRVPAGMCDVIRRSSSGPAKSEAPGAIGADLKCP